MNTNIHNKNKSRHKENVSKWANNKIKFSNSVFQINSEYYLTYRVKEKTMLAMPRPINTTIEI